MNTYIFTVSPQEAERIANGDQTVLVRKKAPKAPFKAVMYVKKENDNFIKRCEEITEKLYGSYYIYRGQGKVIGEFICDKVDFLAPRGIKDIPLYYSDKWLKETLKKAGLTCDQAIAYQGNKSDIYALHITVQKLYGKEEEK